MLVYVTKNEAVFIPVIKADEAPSNVSVGTSSAFADLNALYKLDEGDALA